MELRERLQRLRGQAPVARNSDDLALRIERLRLRRRRPQEAAERDDRLLARALGGQVTAPGVVLLRHRLRSGDVGQCRAPLSPSWAGAAAGVDPGRLLFIDTETTGLAGGSGTLVFLLGLARLMADGGLELCQYLVTRFSGERSMLQQVAGRIGPERVLVSYNGKGFDLPFLSARFRLNRVADPLSGLPHLDLLHPVRRAFGSAWPDCRLQTAEQRLLGFRRRDDLPGAEAPGAWLDWLRRGETARLARTCAHNRDDIVALARLLPGLERVYRDPLANGADPAAVAAAVERAGERERAVELLQRSRDHLGQDALRQLARLLRRQGRLRQAVAIWQRLAAQGDAGAGEELAKYHEHVTGDLRAAWEQTRRLPPGPDRERRQNRLGRKLGRCPADDAGDTTLPLL